MKNIASNN